MPHVTANGCEFYYELSGHGPDLVFIHGEIHGSEYWEYQMPALSPAFRCFAYNRRGHAKTQVTEYGFSLQNQVRDLAALIDHFAIKRPIIVAVAFGTAIAAQYAIQYPERVRGIVMVAWSELHDAMLYFDRWVKASQTVVKILETEGRDALIDYLRREGGRSIYLVIPLDSPIRERCIRMFASHPIEAYRRAMLELATSVPDLVAPFRALSIPVLGVCGDKDPFPDRPEMLAGMLGFREAPPFAGAGRFIHWEQPEAFNRLVCEFVARCPK
jgi:pimeloyl-ACP methyl ester carboxylesterase